MIVERYPNRNEEVSGSILEFSSLLDIILVRWSATSCPWRQPINLLSLKPPPLFFFLKKKILWCFVAHNKLHNEISKRMIRPKFMFELSNFLFVINDFLRKFIMTNLKSMFFQNIFVDNQLLENKKPNVESIWEYYVE